jgi:hypothetical protein
VLVESAERALGPTTILVNVAGGDIAAKGESLSPMMAGDSQDVRAIGPEFHSTLLPRAGRSVRGCATSADRDRTARMLPLLSPMGDLRGGQGTSFNMSAGSGRSACVNVISLGPTKTRGFW